MNATPADSDRPSFRYARWSGLIALLAAEMVSITLRFDAQTVSAERPWHEIAVHSGMISQLYRAVLVATLLLVWPVALAHYRRGELADAVIAHGVANAMITAAVVFGGAWSLWA